ncbi:MAG: hypothetical protein A2X61_11995 [Ignavibacteria bacterium GWB2_35_12]|nr:MAG: hypothetical protein A2X63_05835 [Ignavibacteria bacterium GWA2_35_8]OGU41980.1 MAG: hypothetical protein A2X61_11995 [Ignavibacteria bacterium GWB2_35_12]OGU96053.1 MAG: hypothetical protein A2220_14700 [Ignavibacteria bacterium RIFOXYA2_FULL_35_10]OGV24426.1 MAG: hypothetical protein A2475_12605 [Ignavibacteria bacterium RIFOXYC2_FULL_35_21]
MKSIIILISILISVILIGCNNGIEPNSDCNFPLDTGWQNPPNPIPFHGFQKLSTDGEKLSFILNESVLGILFLRTGKVIHINISDKLPQNMYCTAIYNAEWCPYNSNRLLISAVTYTDTVGDGKNWIWGVNLYIISLDGNEFNKITPLQFPKSGGDLFSNIIWLKESSTNNDFISGFFSSTNKNYIGNKIIKGIYVPQSDEFILPNPYHALIRESKVGYHYSYDDYYTPTEFPNKIYINDNEISIFEKEKILRLTYASWSPNSKLFALTIAHKRPDSIDLNKQGFQEIWIFDYEKYLNEKPELIPYKKINLIEQFCMYGYGIYAEFITDSTLVVSMGGPKADFFYLYEITTDGKLVRQLTFEP